jgi:hypothetical protein
MRTRVFPAIALVIVVTAPLGANALAAATSNTFQMVPSPAQTCLPNAAGNVTVATLGAVDNLHVEVSGLPANTDFDFFVIQVPNPKFGLSWYQGDIETDGRGKGVGDFTGRFSRETFIVAPGVESAPMVHAADASSNPQTAPVHTYHLGLWFNSPTDAGTAGCPTTVTPFNGTHNAGIQVLNTSNFPDDRGPLRRFNP